MKAIGRNLIIEKIEEGTHKELLSTDGYYKKLYDYQFKSAQNA